jgi:predicted Fe-Mo cluster-binding NifX family protein
MKIAIASTEKNKNSDVSDKAGRAPYYLIFDESEDLIEEIDNPFSFGGGGAGFSVAKMLADKEVNIVIAGKFGPKMTEALKDRGLKYREFNGKVLDALSFAIN